MTDPNSTGINELEEKKWLISRIDIYHKTMRELFENDLQRYENYGEKIFSSSRSYRNSILSGLGVILTVALGINATYSMGQILFFGILTALGVASLIVLIFFNIINRIYENLLSSIYAIFTEDIGKLQYSEGYITTSVAHISSTPLLYVDNYLTFITLLSYAILIHDKKELKKIAKKYSRMPQVKSQLIEMAKSYEISLDKIPQFWAKLDLSQPVSSELLEFVNKTLEDYRSKN